MILFNPHDNPGSLALLIISVIYFFSGIFACVISLNGGTVGWCGEEGAQPWPFWLRRAEDAPKVPNEVRCHSPHMHLTDTSATGVRQHSLSGDILQAASHLRFP